jgi:hypothetical protein
MLRTGTTDLPRLPPETVNMRIGASTEITGGVRLRRVAAHQVPIPVLLSAASSVVPVLRPPRRASLHDPCGECDGGSNDNQRTSHLLISRGSRPDLSVIPPRFGANHKVTALLERRRIVFDLAAQERRGS